MAGDIKFPVIAIAFIAALSHAGVPAGRHCEAAPGPGGLKAEASWTVYSTADSGPGTLRQALLDAGYGDLITFDPGLFPPSSPNAIYPASALPEITQGRLTLDAAGAGVILDGSVLSGGEVGLRAVSDSNTVRGLQILNFPGGGIQISSTASENTVEANVISANGGSCGLEILGARNTVTANLIGIDASGTVALGNTNHGICIGHSSGNHIGPGNVIANNGGGGIVVSGEAATGNTITQNLITANTSEGIALLYGGNADLEAPVITVCTETSISGTAPPDCVIEVFSDDDAEGETYEGATVSDGSGVFSFTKPAGLTGPDITATATDSAGNTSAFSTAASVATEQATWGSIKAEFESGGAP